MSPSPSQAVPNLAGSIASPASPAFGRHVAKWAAKLLCLTLVGSATRDACGTQRYVDVSGTNPQPPYTSWATAATNIQDAINAAANGDVVMVNDGVYQFGATVANAQSNRVAIIKPLIVQSVNGPGSTTIQGYQVPSTTFGAAAVRCAYLTNGAVLSGFTLANGASLDQFELQPPANLSGGGVWCQSASAIVSNCVFTGNAASYYGGGAYGGTLQNCNLSGNSSTTSGGGAAYSTVTNCDFNGNTATSAGGAAYYCTMTNCTLENNHAYNGGGVGYGTTVACTLTGNSSTASGGGAAFGTLIDCTLSGNTAHANGGGVNQETAIHCTFSGNTATQSGGAAGSSSLSRCTVNNNSANYGGGAYSGSADNSLFSYNNSSTLGGGTAAANLVNCTVVYNTATTSGGGTAYGTIQNSIVYYNNAPDGNFASTSSLSYCCTTPLPGSGTGNITSDPQLDGSYRLQNGSPCVDVGQNSYVSSAVDLDGNPRIVNGIVDLGAFELPSLATQMFHTWLAGYGLPSDGSADHLDSDGDGMNNWQEYLAGTDPTDPNSVLKIVSGPSASSQDITWMSVSTRTYSLLRSTNLENFSALQSHISGQDGTTTITDTNMSGSRQFFYRVLVDGGLPPQ